MTYANLLEVFEVLKLQWLDLIIPLAVFGLVYAANYAGLVNTSDRKRVAGAIAALALSSLRTVLLNLFGNFGFEEVVQMVIVAGGAWLLAALGYEGKEIARAGLAAKAKK